MSPIKRTYAAAAKVLFTTFAFLLLFLPQFAFAWSLSDMQKNAATKANVSSTMITEATIGAKVNSIATWLLGIAIVLFILKVVFTATNQMLGGETPLKSIPIIGADDMSSKTWKDIWIGFGKQVGIAAGAWAIVQIVVGVVRFAFDTLLTVPSTTPAS